MLLNREVNSGYWDYPVNEVEHATRLLFVSYFDWDQLDYRDNKYVRVQVDQWPARPEIVGKHGLIESHYVKLAKI